MKKIMNLLLVLILVVGILPMFNIKTFAMEQDIKWIPISTKEQLYNIRKDPTANYFLTNDIFFDEKDFSKKGEFYNQGQGWIGADVAFTGVLDGRGFAISGIRNYNRAGAILFKNNFGTVKNLIINDLILDTENGEGYIIENNIGNIENCYFYDISYTLDPYNTVNEGLVGKNDGNIKNCTIEGVTVLNPTYIRSFCGFAQVNNGTISYCKNNITTYTISRSASGICYENYGTVSNCINNMDVIIRDDFCGGIVAENFGVVKNCKNTGDLIYSAEGYSYKHTTFLGGIVAYNNGEINNCINYGNIGVTEFAYVSYAGGICGKSDEGSIENTINIGAVTPLNDNFYGYGICNGTIVGENNGVAILKNNYFLTSQNEGAGVFELSINYNKPIECDENQMKNMDVFKGLDFSNVWCLPENSYPDLIELDENIIKGIFVKKEPNIMRYTEIKSMDFTGLKIAKVLNFGKIDNLISGYDIKGELTKYGKNSVSVEYNKFKTNFEVVLCVPIEECNVDLQYDSVKYTGSALKPTVTVTYNGRKLVKNTDYTVSYLNNLNKGVATVTITGINNYNGTITEKFSITTASISVAKITGIKNKTYNGVKQTQTPTLIYEGKNLKEGIDYKIAYKNNVKAGTASITFSGINNFSGSITKTFKINQATIENASVSGIISKTFNGKSQTQSVKVIMGKALLEKDIDYTVSYSSNVNAGTAKITIKGKNNYCGSISKSFTIKKLEISNAKISGIKTKKYCGKYIEQNISLLIDNKKLIEGIDYSLSYKNNSNAGEATIIIKGKNNYCGSINKSFNISKTDISGAKISGVKTKVYNGGNIKQKLSIIVGGKKLVEGRDYVLKYKNNKNVGKATIVIKGIKNYSGTIKKYFMIKKANQSLSSKLSISVGKKILTGKLYSSAKTKTVYSVNNKNIANISANGKIQIKKPGLLVITIKAKASAIYKEATRIIKIKIVKLNNKLYPRSA